MRKEFQEVGSIRYLEVRQLYEKRKKRVKRLFTWGFDSKSHSRNRWGQNYRASFEIFVPKPTMKDVMKAYDEDNEVHPLVFVKFQNAHNHLLEDYDLEEFMSIPFFGLLNEIEQQRLIDSIYEAHVQIENLMQSMTERFINGGSENQTNNNQ